MPIINWILLPGLGRPGSSMVQWYFSSHPSTSHRFLGDTKLDASLGLNAKIKSILLFLLPSFLIPVCLVSKDITLNSKLVDLSKVIKLANAPIWAKSIKPRA